MPTHIHARTHACTQIKEANARTQVEGERLTTVELLEMFRSCTPPLEALLDALPALSPRYYSIVSSPLVCVCLCV